MELEAEMKVHRYGQGPERNLGVVCDDFSPEKAMSEAGITQRELARSSRRMG